MCDSRGQPQEPRRCGAKTRAGHPCGRLAMPNGRCDMHGGKSTGAKNPHRPLKHGRRTKEAETQRRAFAALVREARRLMKEMEG